MCGICGILYFDGRQVEKEVLLAMRDAMFHRGPDGKGFHIESSLGLGHRRLSIIDLSEKGNQPMLNIDRSLCVIFNGEIYNFKDLRRELEKRVITSNQNLILRSFYTVLRSGEKNCQPDCMVCLLLQFGTLSKKNFLDK